MEKKRAGTATLSSARTFTGGTVISGGTLNLTNTGGSATGSGSITIAQNATLSGAGHALTSTGNVTIDGVVSIGDAMATSPMASSLQVGTTGGHQTVIGSTGSLRFDLFSGAGHGSNTSTLNASDMLVLHGDISLLAGATLIIENPNNMTAWAIGDQWRLWDVSNVGTSTGGFSMASIVALFLTGNDKAFTFDASTGILSIIAPEPGRALFLLLGCAGLLLRRARTRLL